MRDVPDAAQYGQRRSRAAYAVLFARLRLKQRYSHPGDEGRGAAPCVVALSFEDGWRRHRTRAANLRNIRRRPCSDRQSLPLFTSPHFVFARPGHKYILDVFPQFPMLFEIDLNGHLPALLIGHVLDSGHGFIFAQAMVSARSTHAPLIVGNKRHPR